MTYPTPDPIPDLLAHAQEDPATRLAQAQAELEKLAATAEERRGREGVGTAAEGLVQVTAVDGRLTGVRVDPRAARLGAQELAEAVLAAGNAALADLAVSYPGSELPLIDPAALASQLAEAQALGERQMRTYLQNITDALNPRR